MKRLLLAATAAAAILCATSAQARTSHRTSWDGYYSYQHYQSYPIHHRHRHAVKKKKRAKYAKRSKRRIIHKHKRNIAPTTIVGNHRSGLVQVKTAAGMSIVVAGNNAWRFLGFIKDVVDRGYRPPRINCFATGGHVPNSNHYTGNACDFNQRGWGLTDAPMYHVAAVARKWGLRDGCTFRDCGHIDVPHRTASRAERLNMYAALQVWKEKQAKMSKPAVMAEVISGDL